MRADEFTGLQSVPRIAEMLASKACRSAIMIGDPLSRHEMGQVVRNLEGMQRPWVRPVYYTLSARSARTAGRR